MALTPSSRALAATELRRAGDLVQLHAPLAFANDVTEIRRRIGWICAGLEDTQVCERCGRAFPFAEAERYARERMIPPRRCQSCRRQRGR